MTRRSTWTKEQILEQRLLCLHAYYADRNVTGGALKAVLEAHPCTDGKTITAETCKARVQQAIADQASADGLEETRNRFLGELRFVRAKLMERIAALTAVDGLGEYGAGVRALVEAQDALARHMNLERVVPVAADGDAFGELSDDELIVQLFQSIEPDSLATAAPDAVRAAYRSLERIMQ